MLLDLSAMSQTKMCFGRRSWGAEAEDTKAQRARTQLGPNPDLDFLTSPAKQFQLTLLLSKLQWILNTDQLAIV